MRADLSASATGLIGLLLVGCSTTSQPTASMPYVGPVQARLGPARVAEPRGGGIEVASSSEAAVGFGLDDLIRLTLEHNPRLAQVGWAVEAARGKAVQAGLYPNPVVNVSGNELGDRTGPSGIWSGYASQELVTANKLGLSSTAAAKEVDQAALNLVAERYRVLTEVRQAYFDAATLERRAAILSDLVSLAEKSVANPEKLFLAKEAGRLDVVQLEADLERYRAELDAARGALPAAYRKLATTIGLKDARLGPLAADLDAPLPAYDLDQARAYVLGIHPEVRSAQVAVERAELLVRRAEAEAVPNVTVGAGYTRQGQNRSNDWDVGVSVPVPLWNRNQGNVLAARAQLGEAVSQAARTQNDLVGRLSTALGTYVAAKQRTDRYRTAVLPKAQETFELSRKAYQGGQFEYMRVLQAQRTVAETRLELVRSLGEAWKAASEVAGLMLEDRWPPPPSLAPPGRNQP